MRKTPTVLTAAALLATVAATATGCSSIEDMLHNEQAATYDTIADFRDEDAAILSQENGKIRMEAWVDSLVFEIRWNLALALADEVEATKVLPPAPGIPVTTTVAFQPLGVVTVIVPFNWPIAILAASLPHALLAGNTAIVKPPPTAPLATRTSRCIARRRPSGRSSGRWRSIRATSTRASCWPTPSSSRSASTAPCR